jgi:hypothetical protein
VGQSFQTHIAVSARVESVWGGERHLSSFCPQVNACADESKRTKQSSYKHDLAKEAMMKYINKTLRPRLPVELREKLRDAKGGGRHKDKKADFKRRPKHKNKEGF